MYPRVQRQRLITPIVAGRLPYPFTPTIHVPHGKGRWKSDWHRMRPMAYRWLLTQNSPDGSGCHSDIQAVCKRRAEEKGVMDSEG